MRKLLVFFYCLQLLVSTGKGFLLASDKRLTVGSIVRCQSKRLFSNEEPSPTYAGSAQSDYEVLVQRQIDAYLEERSQRQIEQYLGHMSESSDMEESNQDENSKNLMQKIKDSGVAGIIAFGVVQFGFWLGTFPFIVLAFYKVSGHFPDFNSQEDMAFFGGESFAFVNVLRLAAPFRIGFALKLVPWIQENVIDRFKSNV
ncbi:MAG: hypothetical protein SGBAC_012459 [Bacillariaceae sp.]